MKKFLTVIAVCLLSIGMNAQEIPGKGELTFETGYSSVMEYGLEEGLVLSSSEYLVQAGVRYHSGFAWGIGTGIVDREHCVNIPLSLNFRQYYDDLESIAYPFFSITAGPIYDLTNGEFGGDVDLAGGMEIMIDDDTNAYFKAGLRTMYQYGTFLAGVAFSVGINF